MAESLSRYVRTLKDSSEIRGGDYDLVEDFVAVLDDELYNQILGMHVGHLPLDGQISHDSRCEDHSQVLRRHL